MIVSLTQKPKSQAQRKDIRYSHHGNAANEYSPCWTINVPSESNPNNFWTLTYTVKGGKLGCNCPAALYKATEKICKHVQSFKVKLGEAFLSMCLGSNEIPTETLNEVILEAYDDYYLILEDPVLL
tara:strand:- start:4556 stop:4933 length:378 start_codon:yes stop_codon:yes gene_type:complete